MRSCLREENINKVVNFCVYLRNSAFNLPFVDKIQQVGYEHIVLQNPLKYNFKAFGIN
jgi:hypothetical protein